MESMERRILQKSARKNTFWKVFELLLQVEKENSCDDVDIDKIVEIAKRSLTVAGQTIKNWN